MIWVFFTVLLLLLLKIKVCWDMIPSILVISSQHFGEVCSQGCFWTTLGMETRHISEGFFRSELLTLSVCVKLWRGRLTRIKVKTDKLIYDMIYICLLWLGWHPVAVVQYTFTHKQYTERHKNFGRVWAMPSLCLHLNIAAYFGFYIDHHELVQKIKVSRYDTDTSCSG